MKCWKCGNDNPQGTKECLHCRTSLERKVPKTAVGKVMRSIYDVHGSEAVLKDKDYLIYGINSLTRVSFDDSHRYISRINTGDDPCREDFRKFRSRLGLAMDNKIGELYLAQIKSPEPWADFNRKVKNILAEDAGLNDKYIAEVMDAFDEMIGWNKDAIIPSAEKPVPKVQPEVHVQPAPPVQGKMPNTSKPAPKVQPEVHAQPTPPVNKTVQNMELGEIYECLFNGAKEPEYYIKVESHTDKKTSVNKTVQKKNPSQTDEKSKRERLCRYVSVISALGALIPFMVFIIQCLTYSLAEIESNIETIELWEALPSYLSLWGMFFFLCGHATKFRYVLICYAVLLAPVYYLISYVMNNNNINVYFSDTGKGFALFLVFTIPFSIIILVVHLYRYFKMRKMKN